MGSQIESEFLLARAILRGNLTAVILKEKRNMYVEESNILGCYTALAG